ncbi:hypothetical protein FB45DRAFT_1037230, partial [Roridomyces roridus]
QLFPSRVRPHSSLAEEELSEKEREEKIARVNVLNDRITRWFKYRARKVNAPTATKKGNALNPFNVLTAKLSGLKMPPKSRQAYQQYQRETVEEQRTLVADAWKELHDGDAVALEETPKAAFRADVARTAFKKLPKVEQDEYAKRAKEEGAKKRAEYLKALKDGPSQTPEAKQNCINNLGRFLTPIMKGITEYTGCQAFIVVGGPMPKYGGEISTVHLAVGRNNATVPVSFAAWQKQKFQTNISGFYKQYLGTAYTAEDSANAALAGTSPRQPSASTPGLSGALYTIAHAVEDIGGEDYDEDEDEDEDEDGSEEEQRIPSPTFTANPRSRPTESS